VAIFDNRVITKGYGAQFIDSLPETTTLYAPLKTLPDAAVDWLKKS
jgi:Rad3-related DNA helicase